MNREVPNLKSEMPNPKSEMLKANSAVDELLGSFFRSEMPQPWPEFVGPSTASGVCQHPGAGLSTGVITDPARPKPIPDSRSSILYPRSSSRSRWVLAASVIMLLLGSWWLGHRLSSTDLGNSPNSSGKVIGTKGQAGTNKPPRHLSKSVAPQNR
jgi:hypothetical protein